jgi:hypothetical protein
MVGDNPGAQSNPEVLNKAKESAHPVFHGGVYKISNQ